MKKFLSLVLVLVMTMSLVTVGAGAKDFTDDGKITYEEAVDVMSAAGVIDGYTDGSFNPQGGLTRGAAAKIICNMILGPTTAGALSANDAPFKDVPADSTFAGYIAYCANEGIISGYADGTFRPSAPLTGYAFMKMLLGALGYDSDIEGYTGTNWSVNVAKRALNIDLDDDLVGTFVGAKSLNREEACLYAFNAMKATMVEYEDNSTITVGDIVISNKSTAKDMKNSTKTDGYIDKDGLMQFAEKYFDKLKGNPDTDDFGRPATKWTYDGDDVGTYADDPDDSIVLGSAEDLKTVLTDSDYLNYDTTEVNNDAEIYLNGEKLDKTYTALKTAKLGVGDKVEVYEDGDDDVELIIVTRYMAAQIDDIDDDLSSSYTKKGASYSIELTAVDASKNIPGATFYDSYDNNSDKELPGFDADTYVEDAVIAIAVKPSSVTTTAATSEKSVTITVTYGDVILDSYLAEKVTGAVEKYSAKDEYVYVDGTKYKFAEEFDGVATDYDSDDDYDVYITAEGYALAIEGVDTADLDDVYYVIGVYKSSSSYDSNVTYAQAVKLVDGTIEEIKLEAQEQDTAIQKAQAAAKEVGAKGIVRVDGLFTFSDDKETVSKSNNGKYNAEQYKGDSDYSYSLAKKLVEEAEEEGGEATVTMPLAKEVNKDSTSVNLNKNAAAVTYVNKAEAQTFDAKKYITDETQFISLEDDGDDLEVDVETGMMKCAEGDADVVVVIFEDGSSKAAVVIYVGDSFDGSVGTEDVLFLNPDADYNVNSDKDTMTSVWFMDEKAEDDVVLSGKTYKGDKYEDLHGFFEFTTDKDDIYSLTEVSYISSPVDTDKTDGYAKDLVVTAYEKSNCILSDGEHFDDVSYKNAVVIDTRGSDADDDVFTGKIESVADLNRALDKIDNYDNWKTKGITLDVCVEDGEITFIAVIAVMDADQAVDEGDDDGDDPTLGFSEEGNVITYTIAAGDAVPTALQMRNLVANYVAEEYGVELDSLKLAATTTEGSEATYEAVFGNTEVTVEVVKAAK